MKQFLSFVKKEFYHIFRDTRTLLILFGMPVAQIFLFGFAISNEVKNADIAIYDQSKDDSSQQLTNKLLSSGYFKLSVVATNIADIENAFKSNQAKLAIVIPPKFGKDLASSNAKLQLLADASDPNMANVLTSYASGIIMDFAKTNQNRRAGIPSLVINTEVRMVYNPMLKGVFLFVPGVITIILMLVSALLTSIALTKEKELGTMEVLLVSPLSPFTLIVGKVIPYLLLSFINAMVVLVLGTWVFGMPMLGSVFLLIMECLLFIVCALSLGIFISTRTSSQQIAMMVALFALMMPTILLSGFIFPISSMPELLQWLSFIMPAKYFIIIIKGIMLQGLGIAYLWQETLVLAGMTMLFIGAGIKSFNIRLS